MGVTEVAIERIRDLIASGQLSAGQRLPAEAQLAAELGVSRNSMREAVRALAQAGVLTVRQGDGTYVSSLEPQVLLGGLSALIELIPADGLIEIFEVRRLLEPAATGLAARMATDQDVVELRASLDAMSHAGDVEELVRLDAQFHQRVVACTGNATLQCLVGALASQSLRARLWRTVTENGIRTATVLQHASIVEAIAARDPVLAISASTMHVSSSERWLRDLLGLDQPDERRPPRPAVLSADNGAAAQTGVPEVVDLQGLRMLLRPAD